MGAPGTLDDSANAKSKLLNGQRMQSCAGNKPQIPLTVPTNTKMGKKGTAKPRMGADEAIKHGLIRELFLIFALKRQVPAKTGKHRGTVASSEYSEATILRELKRVNGKRNVFLDEKQSRNLTSEVSKRLNSHFERQRKKTCSAYACCACNALRTCDLRKNAWSRTKLLASTVMAYLDSVSDLLTFLAILQLVGDIKSRRYWVVLSIAFLLLPSWLHSYYVLYCEGWRERELLEKLKEFVINLLFLRPLLELFKSCQVSIDLHTPEIEDWTEMDQKMINLEFNGKLQVCNCSITPHIRL